MANTRPRTPAALPAVLLICALSWVAAAEVAPPDRAARADALLAEQGRLLLERKEEAVLAGVDETIAIYRELGDRQGLGAALVVRGLARLGTGVGRETAADLEAAQALFAEAGDPMGAYLVLWMLGEAELREGRFAAAETHLRHGLRVLEEMAGSPEPLDFGGVLRLGRVFGAAVDMVQQAGPAIALLKPILVAFLEVPGRNSLVKTLIDADRLDEAEEELDEAFAAAGPFATVFEASLLLRRGDLARRRWDLDAARESYTRALREPSPVQLVPAAHADVFAWQILDRLEEVESLSGHLPESLAWNDRSLQLARAAGDRSRESSVLQNRAAVLARWGRAAEAERLLDKASAIACEAGDDYQLASALGDLGTQALVHGDYGEAASYLERSAALFRKLGEPYLEAPTLLLLAEAYQVMESPERTVEIIERARQLGIESEFHYVLPLADTLSAWNRFLAGDGSRDEFRQRTEDLLQALDPLIGHGGPFPPDLLRGIDRISGDEVEAGEALARELLAGDLLPIGRAFAHLTLGTALMRQGESEEAQAELDEAARSFHGLGNQDMEGLARSGVAALHWKAGRREVAVEAMDEAMAAFEAVVAGVPVEELLASFLGGGRSFLYGLSVDMLAAAGRPREAFLQAERSRARALLRILGNQRLRPPTAGSEALVDEAESLRLHLAERELSLVTAPAGKVRPMEDELSRARRRYEDLLVRLKVQSPEYASLVDVAPATADEVQQALEPGVTMVSYFLGRGSSHAWVVGRDQLDLVSLPFTRADRVEAACWVREMAGAPPPGAARESAPGDAARGAQPLGPCAPDDHRADRLYRQLFAPVAPLIRGSRVVVVPHGPLHYLPFAALRDPESGRYLVESYELTLLPSASVLLHLRGKESPVEGRALVLGAPQAADPDLRELDGARAEAEEVAALLGVAPLFGGAATEARVRAAAGGVDFLHVAAHGIYQPRNPRFSRLALAADDGHDGNLEAHEVFSSLDLSGVNLVVLSACQTAVGPDAGGDEIVSLARAFLHAGSPGVVSTLWPVDDGVSAELMTDFYQRLLAGERASAALRGAQLELLRSGHPAPYHWAGYTLTGDPGPVRHPSGGSR